MTMAKKASETTKEKVATKTKRRSTETRVAVEEAISFAKRRRAKWTEERERAAHDRATQRK